MNFSRNSQALIIRANYFALPSDSDYKSCNILYELKKYLLCVALIKLHFFASIKASPHFLSLRASSTRLYDHPRRARTISGTKAVHYSLFPASSLAVAARESWQLHPWPTPHAARALGSYTRPPQHAAVKRHQAIHSNPSLAFLLATHIDTGGHKSGLSLWQITFYLWVFLWNVTFCVWCFHLGPQFPELSKRGRGKWGLKNLLPVWTHVCIECVRICQHNWMNSL